MALRSAQELSIAERVLAFRKVILGLVLSEQVPSGYSHDLARSDIEPRHALGLDWSLGFTCLFV
jgi:hypothetical protein